jgi:phosphohistidine swiveling domain-containing protein
MASSLISWLQELPDSADDSVAVVGGKGTNLGRLLRAGFPVPPGFVITTDAYRLFLGPDVDAATGVSGTDEPTYLRERLLHAPFPDALSAAILDAYARLGQPAVAVRSSGTAEDLASASFAGQHETVLDAQGSQALLDAVRVCWASLWSERAIAYRTLREWRGGAPGSERAAPHNQQAADPVALAVVVQRMVPAEVAGVAFTANPVTGDRAETTISAVRGLGERLVSGNVIADEWVVRRTPAREGEQRADGAGIEAICRRAAEGALQGEQALTIADVARQIATQFGAPQDVEWAIGDGQLFILQARPMTALPEPITWTAPAPGGWMRNFRLGEWLPEPVTPLFESWLLARLEESEVAAEARDFGVRPLPPYHVLVHGWYFTSPIGGGVAPRNVLGALSRHPLRIATLALSVAKPTAGESLLRPFAEQWRAELLPRYQKLVAEGERRVAEASPQELIRFVDAVAEVAGEYLWRFSVVGGHAWKVERALATFYQRYLSVRVRGSHQELLLGLPTPFPEAPPHAVQSLDWFRPTLGELARASGDTQTTGDSAARRQRLETQRRMAEAACRTALAGQPRLLQRFDALLALAQRYAVIREEQAGWFTLGWPLLRRAALRLGAAARKRGMIEQGDDVFFLTRQELVVGVTNSTDSANAVALRAMVSERRREWERQRRLSPPLTLGTPPGAGLLAGAIEAMRAPSSTGAGPDVLPGMPASPGRATGLARVVLGPEDFGRVQAGDVLVAQVTAPAWTPLFARVVAVVTDGGSMAAHASLVAREYGIPAVVGVGDATTRLHDGQIVTVDGSAGVVELQP